MASPLISVIMPAHNAERYVSEAIRSICEQTYGDFELLVIDDHSTDNTAAIITRWACRDERIVPLPNKGKGQSAARNTGLYAATGQYIANMDADDTCSPDRFLYQLQRMREDPLLDILGTDIRALRTQQDGRTSEEVVSFPADHEQATRYLTCVGTFWILAHPTILAKKNVMIELGGYSDRYYGCEDLEMWVRAKNAGYRLGNLQRPLYTYYQDSTSVTQTMRPIRYLGTAVLINQARNPKTPISDKEYFPLSVENLHAHALMEDFPQMLSDFCILLRGAAAEERREVYKRVRATYSTIIDRHIDIFKEKCTSAKYWPNAIDRQTVKDIHSLLFISIM